ncbi:MAG: hypothetical protein JNG85_14475 [Spirochaetaceae bacterium]|nr:hypothetical protein [Spirochaetaceae bacterium]
MSDKRREGGRGPLAESKASAETGTRGRKASGPRIVVDGVVVEGGRDPGSAPAGIGAGKPRPRLRHLFLGALAFCAAALGIAAAGILSSCSANVQAAIRADGAVRVLAAAEVPAALAAKLRKLSSLPAGAPLFDPAAFRKASGGRPGLSLVSAEAPSPDSVKAEFAAKSVAAILADPDLAASGALKSSEGPGWAELRLRLERGKVGPLSELLAGIDPYLLEALSPPALEEDPVSAAEYRRMLQGVLGDKALAGLESASVSLAVSAPGAILAAGGGSLAGNELKLSIPAMKLLVLEEPIEIWLRWTR